jgi:hypothetical protein
MGDHVLSEAYGPDKRTMGVALWYPDVNDNINTIEIALVDVRAADEWLKDRGL